MKKRWMAFLILFMGTFFYRGIAGEASEVKVSTSEQFYEAWINQSVTKIELLNDIDYNGKSLTVTAAERTKDIEISGKAPGKEYGYRLKLNNNAFEVRPPTTASGFAEIHIHDIEMENNGTTAYGTRGGIVEDHYGDAGNNVTGNKWTVKFGNVKIPGGWREYTPRYEYDVNGNRVTYSDAQRRSKFNALSSEEKMKYGDGTTARLARTTRAQVNLYGKMSVYTLSENFYTGGLDFAEGTDYNGAITDSNYSAIWFRSSVVPGDAGTGNFIVHDNAKVKVRNTGSGSTFPAIYRFVRNIEVGENSELTLTVPGNSLQFVGANQTFTAKKGSRVTLGSTDAQPSIKFDGTNGGGGTTTPETAGSAARDAKINFEPGSSLFIIGNSSSSMIDMTKGTNNSIVLDTPLQFDIRNTVRGTKNVALEMDTGRTESGNSFQVLKSNIDFWDVNTNVKETPQYSYNDVQVFSARYTNRSFDFITTDTKMQSELPKANGRFARITGLNTVPIAEFPTIITDADKKNENAIRVKLGEVPDDNGMDNNGNLTFEPIYAGKDQAEVTVNDTENTFPEKKILTNVAGYVPLNNSSYYSAGTQLKVKARRSGLVGPNQISPKVIDATPPIPMKQENLLTPLTANTRVIKAEKLNPGAVVYVKINGNLIKDGGKNNKVDDNGKWEFNLSARLAPGDIVTFYLEDDSKKMPEIITYQLDDPFLGLVERVSKLNGAAPITNNNNGNINPDNNLNYADAVFDGVTKFKVTDIEPSTPKINKIARALTKDDKGNQIPQGDGTPLTENDWQGKMTKVNNTLSYRIAVQIPGTTGQDLQKAIYNAKVTDKIPDYLTFNKEDVKVWSYKKGDELGLPIRYKKDVVGNDGKNQFNMGDIDLVSSQATPIDNPIVEYDEASRMLTVGVGDRSKNTGDKYDAYGYEGSNKYGHLSPGDKVVIEFPTVVTSEAVKSTIKNTGKVTGNSGIIAKDDPLEYKEVSATSNEALSPGGDVSGELLLESAPSNITFANTNLIDYKKTIGSDKTSIDYPLVVKDTLKDKNWQITVRLTEEMHYKEGGQTYELPKSLIVTYDGNSKPLGYNDVGVIYKSSAEDLAGAKEKFIISNDWGKGDEEDGLKMKASQIPHAAKYKGTMEWTLENTQ